MRRPLGVLALGLLASGCSTRITVPPPPPASVSAEALPGGAMIGWSDVGAPEYEVLAGSGSSLTVVATTSVPVVRLKHLTPDVVYRIEIRAKGGHESVPVSVVPLPWLDHDVLWTVTGTTGGGLGVSIAAVDFTGDGVVDLVEAGEPFAGPGHADDFWVSETGLFGIDSPPEHDPSAQPGAEAGFANAGAGRALAIGIPGANGGAAGEGALSVIGVDGTARTMSAPASVGFGAFGTSVASGDFVTPGQPGFAAAEPGASRIAVASTAATVLASYAGTVGDRVGESLATWPGATGSVDRLVVGEPGHGGGAGQLEIFSFSGSVPVSQWSVAGSGDQLGTTLAVADVDGDGHDDLLAGSACGGAVVLYAGGSDLPSITPTATLTGPGCFGRALARVDPAGDGEPLLVVGAPSQGATPGEFVVYDGTDVAAGPVWVQTGGSPSFGSSAFGGRFSPDGGREELVVGDPGDPTDPLSRGRLQIFRRRRDHGPRVNAGYTMTALAGQPVAPVLPTFDDPDLDFSSWTCRWTWDATLGTAGETVIDPCTTANVAATSFVFPTPGVRPVVLRVTNDLDLRWGEAVVPAAISAP